MRSRVFDIGGPLHVVEFDGPEDGPVFLLVHGLGGSFVNWLSIAPSLAERGRVLLVDLPGFGRSPLEGRETTVEANRALVGRVIAEVAQRPVVLIGNSMGGLISMLHASAHPQDVAGLVLVDPALPRAPGVNLDAYVAAAFATYMVPGLGERFLARRARSLGPEEIVRQTLRLCCVDPARVDPNVLEESFALARERGEMSWSASAFLQAARSIVRTLARRSRVMRAIREISSPTLMIMGRQDRLVQVGAADAIARARPDWEYVVLEDCGHVPQLERPLETVDAIGRWLEGPDARVIGSARAAG
jgi:pimeloyl-ACP methyl ester carboxylesterase